MPTDEEQRQVKDAVEQLLKLEAPLELVLTAVVNRWRRAKAEQMEIQAKYDLLLGAVKLTITDGWVDYGGSDGLNPAIRALKNVVKELERE